MMLSKVVDSLVSMAAQWAESDPSVSFVQSHGGPFRSGVIGRVPLRSYVIGWVGYVRDNLEQKLASDTTSTIHRRMPIP